MKESDNRVAGLDKQLRVKTQLNLLTQTRSCLMLSLTGLVFSKSISQAEAEFWSWTNSRELPISSWLAKNGDWAHNDLIQRNLSRY